MKKLACVVASILLAGATLCTTSCEFFGGIVSNSGDSAKEKLPLLSADALILDYNLYENSEEKKYKIHDSFELANGNYYYIYYLGLIDYIPLDLSNAGDNGVFFDGINTTLEFSFKQTSSDSSVKELSNIAEASVDLKTTSYVKGSVSMSAADVFGAQLEAGISSEMTNNLTNTLEETVQSAITKEETFEKKVQYNINSAENKRGYYLYTSLASMKIYEVVVYNPNTTAIEYMTPYCEIGTAVPGLIYSPTSFFDYGDYTIEFDEAKLEKFEKPTAKLDQEYEINLNADGGIIESGATVKNIQISLPYGELPTPTKHGYEFAGWYCGSQKVDSESIAVSNKELKAQWNIKTKLTYTWNGEDYVQNEAWSADKKIAKELNLSEFFDFYTLKEDDYKMRITFNYSSYTWDSLVTNISKYKITIESNGTIYTFNDQLSANGNTYSKTNSSELVSLNNVSGTFRWTISTQNIRPIYFKDIIMILEFVK